MADTIKIKDNRSTYPGGKGGSGVYQKIINLIPPHDVYIETHLGGGSIMRLARENVVTTVTLFPSFIKVRANKSSSVTEAPAVSKLSLEVIKKIRITKTSNSVLFFNIHKKTNGLF